METDQDNPLPLFELWNLPSPTNLVFILICFIGLFTILPFSISANIICLAQWFRLILVISVSLRLFLTKPDRKISHHKMVLLQKVAPDVAQEVYEKTIYWSKKVGLKTCPQILYTEQNLPIETIGTFKKNYIIFNRQTLENIRNIDKEVLSTDEKVLDVVLIHELGHILSGDNWKINLSKEIAKTLIYFSIASLIFTFGNPYGLTALFLVGPPEQSNYFISMLSFFVLMLILTYLVNILANIREFFADEIGKVLNPAYKAKFIDVIWAQIKEQPTKSVTADSAFLGQADPVERWNILEKGRYPTHIVRKVLFSGGLALGIAAYSLYSAGIEILGVGVALGGLILATIYLLPAFSGNSRVPRFTGWQLLGAVGIFWAGLAAILIFKAASTLLIYWLNSVHITVRYLTLMADLRIIGLVTLACLLLTVALGSSILAIHWYAKAAGKGRLPKSKPWLILISAIAQGSVTYVLLDIGIKFVFSILFHINIINDPGFQISQSVPLLIGLAIPVMLASMAYITPVSRKER